jgi:hypothetical protein
MHWTTQEINTSYRDAKNPQHQINIIAQCNGCEPVEIRRILGLEAPPEVETTEQSIRKLYEQGKLDNEIAIIVGMSRTQIYYWRTKQKLPCNLRKLEEHPQDKVIMELYEKGYNDAKIGKYTGRLERSICYWRKQRNLETNSKKEKKV